MDSKVKSMIKDALVLTIITLVSGFLLSFVFQLTKEPISVRAYEKKMNAYKTVFESANKFIEDDDTKSLMLKANEIIEDKGQRLGKVGIEEVLRAVDDGGNNLGYVITVYSDEGYGGRVRISMGYNSTEKKVTKIEILEANETAGLGAKISTPNFKNQYSDKVVKQFNLVKSNKSKDDDIQAISGATISSTAVTNSVNAGLLVVGGTNE